MHVYKTQTHTHLYYIYIERVCMCHIVNLNVRYSDAMWCDIQVECSISRDGWCPGLLQKDHWRGPSSEGRCPGRSIPTNPDPRKIEQLTAKFPHFPCSIDLGVAMILSLSLSLHTQIYIYIYYIILYYIIYIYVCHKVVNVLEGQTSRILAESW